MTKLLHKSITEIIRKVNPDFGYKKSDVILGSYPKSGRNWVMFLLANTMLEHRGINLEANFHNIHDIIPEKIPTESTVEGFPRLMATHKEESVVGNSPKVIYLVRHPGDVMESYFHFLRGRYEKELGSFSEFIRCKDYGIPAWKSHVNSWKSNWDVLIRFEDLKDNTLGELEKIVSILDKPIKDKTLKSAMEKSSFERMREIEQQKGLPYKKGANPNYQFMRKGKAQKGENYFDEEDYRFLCEQAGKLLEFFKYEC